MFDKLLKAFPVFLQELEKNENFHIHGVDDIVKYEDLKYS